jgi:hypothetical protein
MEDGRSGQISVNVPKRVPVVRNVVEELVQIQNQNLEEHIAWVTTAKVRHVRPSHVQSTDVIPSGQHSKLAV